MKRRLKLFTVLLLTLGLLLPAGEALAVSRDEKIAIMKDLGIVNGYPDGSLGLDRPIKRSEAAALLVRVAKAEYLASQRMPIYPDVPMSHWANGYIAVTKAIRNKNGVTPLDGYPDGTFRPEKNITNAEMMKILVSTKDKRLTKARAAKATWPDSWIQWAEEVGIAGPSAGLENLSPNTPATRGDVFVMLFNGFAVKKTPNPTPAPNPAPVPSPTPGPKPGNDKPDRKKSAADMNNLIIAFNMGVSYDSEAFKNEFTRLINVDRARLGLNPLAWSDEFARGAEIRCKELAANGDIDVRGQSHVRLDGSSWETAFDYMNLNLRGENLLSTGIESTQPLDQYDFPIMADGVKLAQELYRVWWESPGHRANMMYADYKYFYVEAKAAPQKNAAPYKFFIVGSTHFKGE